MTKGKLYGVGVGPGDPELLTIKAVKIINKCSVLAVPKTKGEKNVAMDIIKNVVDLSNKEILYMDFPMVKDKEVLKNSYIEKEMQIEKYLLEGKDTSFITLGDVSIYSTFSHVQKIAEEKGFETEICPGVTSFSAVGARLKISLTSMKTPLHIIPAVHGNIEKSMNLGGTKVFMKAGKNVAEIFDEAKRRGLTAKGICNCTMEDEKIISNADDDFGYFTTIVVKESE